MKYEKPEVKMFKFDIEDVITTARTIFETMEAISEFECEIVGIGCIVDRTQGKMEDKFKMLSYTHEQVQELLDKVNEFKLPYASEDTK